MTLDETSGLVASDGSGNGNNGNLTAFSGDNSYWTNGWIAGGLAFNQPNVTNYVLIPDNGTLNLTNNYFTLAAWIKMNNAQLNGSCVIARGTGNGGESYDRNYCE